MTPEFYKSINRVFKSEGKFTDDPEDRGNWTSGKIGIGELKGTKFGISAMAYPHLDIKNLTLTQVRVIYYEDWWLKLGMDKFSSAMQFQMFDAAINHGMRNATKIFQRTVETKADGIIGAKTRAAAQSMDLDDKILRFNGFRLKFYTSIKTFDRYGRGWTNRVADNLIYGAEDN